MASKPRINSNLAATLDEDQAEEVADMVVSNYHIDEEARGGWLEKRARWYQLWLVQPDPNRRPPWPDGANVALPLMASACNQFQARSYQSIFQAPGLVKVLPMEANDHGRAGRVEAFLNWQLSQEMTEYEGEMDKLLQKLPIDGVAFTKLHWSTTKQRPVCEFVSAQDLLVPYRTRTLESARRITHRLYLHLDELKLRAQQGFYENVDLLEVAQYQDTDAIQEVEDRAQGEDGVAPPSEVPHLILECHMLYQLNGDSTPRPYTFWVDEKTGTLLRATRREYRGQEVTYFTDYHFIPNPEGFYSYGYGHFLETINGVANTVFNQIIDSGRLTNQPFGFYGRRAGFRSRNLQLRPGAMFEVEDANQVTFPTLQRLDQSLPQILSMLDRYTELFTSNSEPMSGRQQKGVREPTARGTLALIDQGMVSFGVLTKRVYRSMRSEFTKLVALNSIFQSAGKQYRVLGETDHEPFGEVYNEDFRATFDLAVVADPTYASRGARKEEAGQIMQVALQHPLIGMPNQQTGELANPAALLAFTRNYLETFERVDLLQYFPEPPSPPMSPEKENALFLQGDTRDPVSGENHEEHIAMHVAFLQSSFGASMTAERVQAMITHVEATQAIMLAEEQALAQQQQQPQEQQQPQQPQQQLPDLP